MNNKYLQFKKFGASLSHGENGFLEQIILSSPHIIFWKDENLVYRGCNFEFAHLMGFDDPADLIGKTDYQLPLNSDYVENSRAEDLQVINTGKPIFSRKKIINFDIRDSKQSLFSISKVPLYDENNRIIGCLCNCVDITEQEKISEKLRREIEFNTEFLEQFLLKKTGSTAHFDETTAYVEALSEYYDSIIGNMPGNVYWLNKEGILLGGNDNLARMFGLESRAELVGLNYEEMAKLANWTEDQGKVFRATEIEVMNSRIPIFNKEEPPVVVNGKKTYYLANKVPLFDNTGDVIGVLGVSLDITSKIEAEKALMEAKKHAEQANEAKTKFLMDMSHEVRTPLTGILGMANLVRGKLTDPEAKANMDLLANSAEELANLFNDILIFIKINSGQSHGEQVDFDLRQLIINGIKLLKPVAEVKKLAFNCDIDPQIPQYFIGNKILLKSIVLNLLSNALKFTQSGEVRIKVQLKNTTEEIAAKKWIQIYVEDTGIGIPEEKFDSIFDSFVTLKSPHEGKNSGHGLGLYLVKQYVEVLNGKIEVQSQFGKGSTFIVEIPLILSDGILEDDSKTMQDQGVNFEEALKSRKIRILLVEDHDIAAKVEVSLFEKFGLIVDRVDTGEGALEQVKAKQYDLIYMDIGLPGIDGFETAATIRKMQGNPNAQIPIIALTAHLIEGNNDVRAKEFMQEVVTKPISPSKVQQIVAKYILCI